jgi:hypothetical protein
MTPQLIEPPTDFTVFELAEWLETAMVLEGIERISQAEIEDRFPVNQRPEAAVIEELAAEIGSRADMAPATYPFRAGHEEIFIDPTIDPTIYLFLLVLSIESAPYRTQSRYNEIGPSLELLTREAMLAMLGSAAEGRRFGWPAGDGRPELLLEAVEWLASEMGLEVGEVAEDVDEDDKDGGIDVAAWHPFPDKRPSFPVYLIQCTVQATYERKPADVVPDQWAAWIRFGRHPDIGLAVPFAIPPDAKVRLKLRYTTDVLLDRMRLCVLTEQRDLASFEEYGFMSDWTAREIGLIRDELTAPQAADAGKAKPKPKLARKRRPRKE